MSEEARLWFSKACQFLTEAEKANPAESPLSIVHDGYYAHVPCRIGRA